MSREAPSAAGAASRIVRDFLAGAIDYAGLFPPAALDMRTAIRNYASYRAGDDASLLGRFVAPATRLSELAEELESLDPPGETIKVSAVLGANLAADIQSVIAFNARVSRAAVDSVEAKADRPGAIYELASGRVREARGVRRASTRWRARVARRCRARRRRSSKNPDGRRHHRSVPERAFCRALHARRVSTPAFHSRRRRGCTIRSRERTR